MLQPWTEDPRAATDARRATRDSSRSPKSLVAGLRAMEGVAQAVLTLARSRPAWMGVALQKELEFLGMDNIRNHSAVENLIAMGRAATAVWAVLSRRLL